MVPFDVSVGAESITMPDVVDLETFEFQHCFCGTWEKMCIATLSCNCSTCSTILIST